MAFRIPDGKSLPKQTKAVFIERIQLAMAEIRAYGARDPQGLHQARKNLKRSRSLLRLLRQKKFRSLREKLNAGLRETARSLSLSRDREVLVSLLKVWTDAPVDGADARILHTACKQMIRHLLRGENPATNLAAGVRETALENLAAIKTRMEKHALSGLTAKGLRGAAGHAYTRLQAAFTAYLEMDGITEFHDLRKRAKDHLYHRQILRDVLDLSDSRTRRLRQFEGLLGSVRDCDLLLEAVNKHWNSGLEPSQVASLVIKAEMERASLLEEALKLGHKLLCVGQAEALSR